MAKVTYLGIDGSSVTVEVPPGKSIMEAGVENNIAGLVAECGGSCACATCHVYLAASSMEAFPPAEYEESDLLEFAEGSNGESRLSCQLVVTEDTGDIQIRVAEHNG